jgi:ribosomal protein L21E
MENEAEKMKLMVKVEKAGITIPMERLKDINEGDIVQIQIEKLYMNNKVKKDLRNIYLHA